jgi:hypothetical protein
VGNICNYVGAIFYEFALYFNIALGFQQAGVVSSLTLFVKDLFETG